QPPARRFNGDFPTSHMMRRFKHRGGWSVLVTCLLFGSSGIAAYAQSTIEIFGSGLARRTRTESSLYPGATDVSRQIRRWEGAVGVGFRHPMACGFSFEL